MRASSHSRSAPKPVRGGARLASPTLWLLASALAGLMTWPVVAEELWENVKNLDDRMIDKITHQNVFDFFGVDPIAEVGGRDKANVGALRALAKNVDTTARSLPGKDARIIGDPSRPVTAGDAWATLAEKSDLEALAAAE